MVIPGYVFGDVFGQLLTCKIGRNGRKKQRQVVLPEEIGSQKLPFGLLDLQKLGVSDG